MTVCYDFFIIFIFCHVLEMYLQIGGTYARPVILPPEVAIGALGKLQVRPFPASYYSGFINIC